MIRKLNIAYQMSKLKVKSLINGIQGCGRHGIPVLAFPSRTGRLNQKMNAVYPSANGIRNDKLLPVRLSGCHEGLCRQEGFVRYKKDLPFLQRGGLFIKIFVMLYGLFFVTFAQDAPPPIFINEFMASNSTTVRSPDFNEYVDWLELFNGSDSSTSISGFYLTDDLKNPLKWQIPAGIILGPGETILIWADGRDRELHTNFSLSKEGEEIGLFSATGLLIDSVRFTQQYADISFGRSPNGATVWLYFDEPSPGESNLLSGFIGKAPAPEFLPDGGFYTAGITLELMADNPSDTIRYTIDGSIPERSSAIYKNAGFIDKTTVVRARTYRNDHLPGRVVTKTYFINELTRLPVISVATDPENLWDDENGIYVEGTNGISGYCSSDPKNWNQPWEKPISIEMYEANRAFAFRMDAGMQIGGGCTRKYPQKSLAVYARSEYGFTEIDYPLFNDKPMMKYNNLLLRNSGQDWWRALIRDGTMHTLVKGKMDIDWQAYKPAVVFLNGEYWGIHGIREKHNEHYLAGNYGINPDEIDILTGNQEVKQGSADDYKAMIDFIEQNTLSDVGSYNWVESRMDINEYLNYVISEIYFANIDWPAGNIKYWRQQGPNHKWRWILFDTDLGFGAHGYGQYNSNTLENATAPEETYYANPSWSTFLLRNLLENSEFRNRFIQRFASHLNITFNPQRVLPVIDSLKLKIEEEIPRHVQKWEQSTSFNEGWSYHIDVMKEFAIKRPEYVLQHLSEKYNLNGMVQFQVTSNGSEAGTIYINGVAVPGKIFSGSYFMDIPLSIKAEPKSGYRFAGWKGVSEAMEDSIILILTGDCALYAEFEPAADSTYTGIRINEFMALNQQTILDEYGENDDWIELYNDSPLPVDIGGMYLTDDLDEPDQWQIPDTDPEATTIEPGGFILLWADNDPEQGPLHLNFRLSGDGEEIGISNQDDNKIKLIDSLEFGLQKSDVSWGRMPDGGDDFQFYTKPTPGQSNKITGLSGTKAQVTDRIDLVQNYPNPFNSSTRIQFRLNQPSKVKIVVVDITGQVLEVLVNRQLTAGIHTYVWVPGEIASGQYFLKLSAGYEIKLQRMLYLK